MKMHERIRYARRQAGYKNQAALARDLGVTRASVTQWEIADGTTPNWENLKKLAALTGFNPLWLREGAGPEKPIDSTTSASGVRKVPVIDYCEAGRPREVVDAYAAGGGFDEVAIYEAQECGAYAFALRISGDSMAPLIQHGDTVIVDPDAPIRPGDTVVAKMARDETATVKRYRERGRDQQGNLIIELVPNNPDYASIVIDSENPGELVGRVTILQKHM